MSCPSQAPKVGESYQAATTQPEIGSSFALQNAAAAFNSLPSTQQQLQRQYAQAAVLYRLLTNAQQKAHTPAEANAAAAFLLNLMPAQEANKIFKENEGTNEVVFENTVSKPHTFAEANAIAAFFSSNHVVQQLRKMLRQK